MSKRVMKLGVVGLGGRSGHVADTGARVTDGLFATVACVEPSDDRHENACRVYNIRPARFPSVEEMVRAADMDAIIIGTPNELHLSDLRQIRNGRLPILLEKPLDAGFEQICDVVRYAEKHSAPILVGHCMRFAPILAAAKEMLRAGAIGRVCSTRFTQNCHYGNGMWHTWRRNAAKCGTMFIEKATHDLDVMFWLLEAKPTQMFAVAKVQVYGGRMPNTLRCRDCDKRLECPESTQNICDRWGIHIPQEARDRTQDLCVFAGEADTPDNEACMMQFDTGAFGAYTESFFTPRGWRHRVYELIGDKGVMEIDLGAEHGGDITVCPRYGCTDDQAVHHFDYLERNHYNGDGEMMRHFHRVIEGLEAPGATVKQAFVAEVAGYAAIQSAQKQAAVDPQSLLPDDLKHLWQQKLF